MHPIITDLMWRYTVKSYDPVKKVSEEDLAILFEAMRLSASSINSQPWRFIVLDSEESKLRMSETFNEKFQFNQKHILNASQIILFAHKKKYSKSDYAEVVDKGITDKRTKRENRDSAFTGFTFAELNTDENGSTEIWTKAQLYLALGNTLHTLARLKIGATAMEGIDTEKVNKAFLAELEGYQCDVALAIGYQDVESDFNGALPKSRLSLESVLKRI